MYTKITINYQYKVDTDFALVVSKRPLLREDERAITERLMSKHANILGVFFRLAKDVNHVK